MRWTRGDVDDPEVRRQFANIPELKAALGKMQDNGDKPIEEWSEEDRRVYEAADGKAEYASCVAISTDAAIKEMIKPGVLAVLTPVVVALFGTPSTRRPRRKRWADC